jgi:hypothetical protein
MEQQRRFPGYCLLISPLQHILEQDSGTLDAKMEVDMDGKTVEVNFRSHKQTNRAYYEQFVVLGD